MWVSRYFFLSTLFGLLASSTDAFGPFAPSKAAAKASSLKNTQVEAAVALYQKKFPPNRAPRKRAFNAGVGLPVRDLDGTKLRVAKTREMGQAYSDRSEADLRATYGALSKFFGDDEALQMVKDFPLVLTMNRNNLAAIMDAYGTTFGSDEAAAMVQRNPGLLFCKPKDAAEADNLTMQLSYVVAATRPLGPFLLYGLLFLLFEPALELATGIPLKAMLLSGSS